MLERLRAVVRATSITRAIASPAVIASPSALTTGAASDASASASIAYGGSRSAPLRTRKRAVTGLRQTLARSLRRRAWWMTRVKRASIPAFRRYFPRRSNPGVSRVDPVVTGTMRLPCRQAAAVVTPCGTDSMRPVCSDTTPRGLIRRAGRPAPPPPACRVVGLDEHEAPVGLGQGLELTPDDRDRDDLRQPRGEERAERPRADDGDRKAPKALPRAQYVP